MAFDDKFAIRLILIVVLVVILAVLITQYNKKVAVAPPVEGKSVDMMKNYGREAFTDAPASAAVPTPAIKQQVQNSAPVALGAPLLTPPEDGVQAAEPASNEDYMAVDFEVKDKTPASCYPRDTNTPEDLIPKGAANSKWAQVMPAGQGDVKDQNFLTAGHHIGINTVGQSLRNANMQLRSDPPVPRAPVGPWLQSTIEYDNSRRQFEIGQC